jgi:hypothetical protein
MIDPRDFQIAGSKTCEDWRIFRPKLVVGGDANVWKQGFLDYFHARLSLRYFNPIRILQDHSTYQGEGFSIVAIQCSLIEFLESTVRGLSYRYPRKGERLGPHEYSNSKDLFVSFLCERHPFSKEFNGPIAQDFYEGVRCGLLHEARTKNDWTISGKGTPGSVIHVTQKGKVVYRNNFEAALLEFVGWYEQDLATNASLQEAFIRKFDSLCK